jgi:hypothetical protein
MKTTTKTGREYRVEGHGASLLVMHGGVSSKVNAFAREPLLTREGAWSTVKALAKSGQYHTIKVFRGGALAFRAWRQNDGTYMDPVTCKTVAV